MTVTSTTQDSARRGPGRPRIPDHEQRILDAVVAMVDRNESITVNAVVEASGVSRAALYRRWSSMTELVATALDRGRSKLSFDLSKPVKEAVLEVIFENPQKATGETYTDRRFRKRIELVMTSHDLQEAYWQSHVHRRRAAMVQALQVGVERGELRADLDVEAAIDGINGVFYYQTVVRGSRIHDPETWQRCREAFEIMWLGMQA